MLDRLEAFWLEQLAAFDASGGFAADGAASTISWLRHQGRLAHASAARYVKRARQLRQMPVTAGAARSGLLSGGQLDAIFANVPARLTELYAEAEAGLVPALAELPAADVGRVMRHWAARADDSLDEQDPRREPDRQLVLTRLLNDRLHVQGHIDDPVGAAVVEQAICLARTDEPDRPITERNADALVDVCRFFLDNHELPTGRHNRPHIVITFDADRGETETISGHRIDDRGLETLLCDAAIQRLIRSGSVVLDYGTTTYTVSPQLWQAVGVRDCGCRFPGCDRPLSWCDCHHVKRYPEGPTAIGNLVMLCSYHHKLLHRPDWDAELLPDAT